MNLAPIALFAYNRPWHVRKTVEALQKNELSGQSELFIYADGPKNKEDQKLVNEVRQYLRSIRGFKRIEIIEQKHNSGLADAIASGVTELVGTYGKIIVLEDDLITSPYFLRYMNDALKFYKEDEQVMHIAGYMLPINSFGLPETFFYRIASCWGWGTWKRAWKHFDRDVEKVAAGFSLKQRRQFNLDGCADFWQQVKANQKGDIRTWAVFWSVAVFLNQGLCLHPAVSMVQNIGYDDSGSHCSKSDIYQTKLANHPVFLFKTDVVENEAALSRIKDFYRIIRPNLRTRIVNKLKRMYGR